MLNRNTVFSLAMAMTLLPCAPAAIGAEADHEEHHPGPATTAPTMPGMPMASMPGASAGMPMMGMMQMMMGQNGMAGHVEGRIAFLKAELKITDAQQSLWNVVADVMRANAKDMADMPNRMVMMGSGATLPDKLAMQEKTMAAYLDGLRKLRGAVEQLYAAFSPDQKKTADELMIGPMGIMGMGIM
jgi:hypothetical protein